MRWFHNPILLFFLNYKVGCRSRKPWLHLKISITQCLFLNSEYFFIHYFVPSTPVSAVVKVNGYPPVTSLGEGNDHVVCFSVRSAVLAKIHVHRLCQACPQRIFPFLPYTLPFPCPCHAQVSQCRVQ